MTTINGCVFPKDLYYWKDHTWARIRKEEKKVRIGLDNFAQRNAGEIEYLSIRLEGSLILQGDAFAMIEAYKWVGPLKSPLGGIIVFFCLKIIEYIQRAIASIKPLKNTKFKICLTQMARLLMPST